MNTDQSRSKWNRKFSKCDQPCLTSAYMKNVTIWNSFPGRYTQTFSIYLNYSRSFSSFELFWEKTGVSESSRNVIGSYVVALDKAAPFRSLNTGNSNKNMEVCTVHLDWSIIGRIQWTIRSINSYEKLLLSINNNKKKRVNIFFSYRIELSNEE